MATTTSNQVNTPESTDGFQMGGAATSKVGFYGATPVTQPTHASQAAATAITDTSGGTVHLDTGMQALTSSYNSGILANSLSSVASAANGAITLANCLRAELVTLGIIKGS